MKPLVSIFYFKIETGKIAMRYPLYLKTNTKSVPELQPMDIRSHIKEIYRKLSAKNKTEAVMIASEMKLI